MPSVHPAPNTYDVPPLLGPGKHDPRFPAGPAYSLSPRIDTNGGESYPAPNTYVYDNVYRTGVNDNKGFALGCRVGKPPRDLCPAPGQYEPMKAEKHVYKTLPAYGFGGKEKPMKLDENPGPGHYDPAINANIPTFAIRGRPRSRRNENNPGPGTYDVSPRVTKDGQVTVPAITIKGRDQGVNGSDMPGPGTYEVDIGFNATHKSLPVPTFKGKGRDFSPSTNPGPGTYNPRIPEGNKGFSVGGRERDWRVSDTPGPGQYELDSHTYRTGKENGKPVTIRGRPRDGSHDGALGPGSYTPDFTTTHKKNPTYSMGKRVEYKSDSGMPGPGTYDPLDPDNGKKGFEIRGRPRDSSQDRNPGPGEYEINDKIHYKGKQGGPAFTMYGKEKDPGTDNKPGPGHYNPDHNPTKPKNPVFSFTPRGEWHEDRGTPGPGHYTPRDINGGPVINIKGRPNEHLKDTNPGPGQYEVADKVYKNGKITPQSFTMGKRDDKHLLDTNPGPGHYDPKDGSNGPKWSIHGRGKESRADHSPGPGHYDPRDGHKIPVLSMDATGHDRSGLPGNTPGPGHYDVDNSVFDKTGKKAPAFTMTGKEPFTYGSKSNPGPGHYFQDINSDPRVNRGPNYTIMGKGKDVNTSDAPGPGYYDPDPMIGHTVRSTKPRAPQFSMYHRDTSKGRDTHPGPGHYEIADTSVYKKKPPAFSIGLKNREGDVNTSPRIKPQANNPNAQSA